LQVYGSLQRAYGLATVYAHMSQNTEGPKFADPSMAAGRPYFKTVVGVLV